MAIRAVKKITAKDVMGSKIDKEEVLVPVLNDDMTPVLDNDDKPVTRKIKVAIPGDKYVVYGNTDSHRVGKSAYGDSYVFSGNFEARRLSDGEIFISTEVIFPPIAQDLAVSAYIREKAKDKNATIEFAFVIGIEADTRGTEGFKFTCKPVRVGEATSDPLEGLKSSLAMNFAEALGLETMQKLGLPAPGGATMLIDSSTGEVQEKEPETATAGKGKASK